MSAMKARFQIAECSQLYQKKEGRGDFRKNPSLRVREDWWVFEKPLIMAKRGQVDFLNKILLF